MKKILLTWMMLASAFALQAEDNHLYIQPNAGEKLSWSVPSLQKMTFQDGSIVLTKKDGTIAYASIATVKRMYISTPSAENIEGMDVDLIYSWNGDKLQINVQPGTPITVYNVAGAVVLRENCSGDAVDFQGVGRGLYIVNVGGQTFKIVKK
ncbi:MAG: T9SS type A sorting domain-containing protein [Bacteroidaceae bacterium]|nr:T9SS type A sorting domain-containing protein [Bacteroidaceae bacterium]